MKINLIPQINKQTDIKPIYITFFACLSVFFLSTTLIYASLYINTKKSPNLTRKLSSNIISDESSEERHIKVISNVTEEGEPNASQGKLDIKNSPYFQYIDIFNMKSSGNLILLEKFKTYQQTSPYTCGIASLIMAVNYLDGTVLNETEMAIKAEANNETGIFIANLEKLVGELGYEYECKTNFTEEECPSLDEEKFSEYIRESLANKEPIIVISNDWGGHYSVIIGYDDMGTKDFIDDDVIILADPYDTSDHINDGYTIFSYERFYYQMAIKVFGIENQDLNFIRIKRKNSN